MSNKGGEGLDAIEVGAVVVDLLEESFE